MRVEKLDRVSLDVKNLDEAVKLFSELLETTFYRSPTEEPKLEISVTEHGDRPLEKSKFDIAISPIGLELIESVPPAEIEGIRSFYFKVSDLEEAKAEMKKKGIRLVAEVKHGGVKEAVFSPHDLHGARIVLAEYKGSFILDAVRSKT